MHVRDAYTALLAGASLYSIAAQLNDAGVTTTTGRAFTHNAVRQILANPRNAAIRRHRGVEVGPAAWPALVPESTFRSATSMLADESRRTNTIGGERRHLLTGVGLCGVCGDGTTVHAASRAKDTPIYVCRRSRHLVRLLAHVDEFVEETVLERLSRPDATELLVDRQAPDVEALNAERVRLVAEQSADMADMKAGLITRRQLHEANAITVRRIAEIDEAMSHRSRERVLGELARAADPRPVWASLSLQRRQAVLRELGDWVIYRGQAGGVRSGQRRAARVEWVPGPGITA
jgi:site-specific DNA recombinase